MYRVIAEYREHVRTTVIVTFPHCLYKYSPVYTYRFICITAYYVNAFLDCIVYSVCDHVNTVATLHEGRDCAHSYQRYFNAAHTSLADTLPFRMKDSYHP